MKRNICVAILLLGIFVGWGQVFAQKFRLRDGRILEGQYAQQSSVDEISGTEYHIARPIALIDDGLRRVYLSKTQIDRPIPEQSPRLEPFPTGQRPNSNGTRYHVPGSYNNRTPFNEFGSRLLHVHHPGGVALVEQAIVELNPYYIRVTSLRADLQPVVWEMRIATNAIPREQITPILMKQIGDPQNINERMRLVRFYYGGGLFDSADAELESILQDWKDDSNAQQRLLAMSLNVRQAKYKQILDEIELRWESGQYRFVRHYTTALEQDPKLPERLLEPVRQLLRRFDETDYICQEIVTAMRELYSQLPEEDQHEKIPAIITEIEKELNFSTLKRLETFQLYAREPQLSAAEKLAIGITGWYAGANASNRRLAVALMLPDMEKLIIAYLRSGHDFVLRQRILEQLKNLETARPDLVAAMLATMKPPFSDLPPEDPEFPGYYRFNVPNPLIAPGVPRSADVAEIRYTVQLPPDYNPYQRYPMIVSLNGSQQTPDMQIDWWTGSWREGNRTVHATRYGYIVIAPDWNPQGKPDYDFSIFPHAAVLCSVRDALRRFSVNTDKVFLSGHGIGGTAAWDIAQAHPDLWAGAIAFNAVASAYIDTYWETAWHVPLYLVWGEMEGVGARRKWNVNATTLNRHLLAQKRPNDVTAVRYIGRGMEGFSEEILNILEWMNLRQRDAVPSEFNVKTMRPWDSFFWWIEMMPNLLADRSGNMVDPIDFHVRGNVSPLTVQSRLNRATNGVSLTIRPPVANMQVFLSPDMVDFRERVVVTVNNKRSSEIIEPDIEVMLEDVRTRGDRIHPFWARLDGR